MSLALCLLFFIVPVLTETPLPQSLLEEVFGSAPPPPDQLVAQASAVTPDNSLALPADTFTPAPIDYDKFDWSLTKRIASGTNESFLISPLCLKLALAILTEAATGPTKSELATVMGFDANDTVVRKKFSTIIDSLETKSSQYILNLGSRIYVYSDIDPKQKFASVAAEHYKTQLTNIDFGKPVEAAKMINDWVANITEGKIPKLVSEDDVLDAVIMIIDTLYFKGTWRKQFSLNDTTTAQFYVTPKLQKPTLFMNVKGKFYYAESPKYDAKILRMPYLGNKFSMYLVVPNSLTGLSRVIASLGDMKMETAYLQEQYVDVTIPKFDFEYTSHMNEVLRELGIRQAFEDTASFPGIARGQALPQRLKVSKVLQKSGIEVNELGTVAYAATEITLVNKFGEDCDSYIEFIANKPFLFFIEDEATRQLLFTGSVTDPSRPSASVKQVKV